MPFPSSHASKFTPSESIAISAYPRTALNLFSENIDVHQKPSSAIFREGIRLGLVYRVRVSFR